MDMLCREDPLGDVTVYCANQKSSTGDGYASEEMDWRKDWEKVSEMWIRERQVIDDDVV